MAQPTRTAPPPAPPKAPPPAATHIEVKLPSDELIPVPADPATLGMGPNEPEVNKLFRLVMKMEASDLHLKVGQPPMMRLRGDIRKTDMKAADSGRHGAAPASAPATEPSQDS